jgi:predicted house-cleaning noncanonical NTP pyrophosphatase (MazG superfamily)
MKKLIRDNIPDIAKAQGRTLNIEVASDAMLSVMIRHKLQEELEEVLEAYYHDTITEELGDLLDVIDRFMEVNNITKEEVEAARKKKNEKNGGFLNNYILTTND